MCFAAIPSNSEIRSRTLDPYRQPAGQTAYRCHPVRHRKLPPAPRSVRDYLAAILPGLADMLIQRVAGLTPAAWAAKTHA